MRLAAGHYLVEQLQERLAGHFRQRQAHGLAADVPVADQLQVGVVDQFEDMLRPAQHGHEARRLAKQAPQHVALRGQLGEIICGAMLAAGGRAIGPTNSRGRDEWLSMVGSFGR